jgi:hypothetical protein
MDNAPAGGGRPDPARLARKDRRIVEENTLEAQVAAARRALESDRDLIRTVAGRGYQFIGAVARTRAPIRWRGRFRACPRRCPTVSGVRRHSTRFETSHLRIAW